MSIFDLDDAPKKKKKTKRHSNLLDEALEQAASRLSGATEDYPDGWQEVLRKPETDDELWDWIDKYLNIQVPRGTCGHPEHTPPFEAVAEAYFARAPRTVWVGSRGTGKSVLLAALGLTEAITLGAGVTILGGSGEQSQRVHRYMEGEDTNLPNSYWAGPSAPKWLLKGDPTKRDTRLRNGGWISALMASPTSVRGPHPQRLRGDEIDEMKIDIWDSAQGQPQENAGIREQVVGSSTHQHGDGTMTRELRMAKERKWPIRRWCIYCIAKSHGGFLPDDFIDRKRAALTKRTWEVEYLLHEPLVEDRAIDSEAVDRMFIRDNGIVECEQGDVVELEAPKSGARYSTGADWGKARDKTVITTVRTDVTPIKIVAAAHLGQIPFPQMVDIFNKQVERYDSTAAHDATGLGSVIDDYIEVFTEGIKLVGITRSNIFSEFIASVENDEWQGQKYWDLYYNALKFATYADLYGKGHPPDAFISLALAYHAATQPTGLVY